MTVTSSLNDPYKSIPHPPRIWPGDLATLGLTEVDKNTLEKAFDEALSIAPDFSEHGLMCRKTKVDGVSRRRLQLFNEEGLVREWNVPITLMVNIQQATLKSIVLWTKVIIGEGGDRRVRKCYDLITGEINARKKFCNTVEKLILQHFQSHPSAGIESITSTIEADDPYLNLHGVSGIKKPHFVEPCFEGDLFQMLDIQVLDEITKSTLDKITNPRHVISIMEQLLTGLATLHEFVLVESIAGMPTQTYPKTKHWDIKPANILLRKIEGNWEAVLMDFGHAATLAPGNGSDGYLSPEDVCFRSRVYPDGIRSPRNLDIPYQEIVETTSSYAQKKDVWQLGLVFVSLLMGRIVDIELREADEVGTIISTAPLDSLVNAIKIDKRYGHHDWRFAKLRQDFIDRDIVRCKAETLAKCRAETRPAYAYLWDYLISKMLQVDPAHRISSKEALSILLSHLA